MSTNATTAHGASTATGATGAFLWARLGSMLSILPLGVWTVFHLWANLASFSGADEWERKVTHHEHPIALGLTMFFVLGPLLLHTAWGIQRLFSSRPNNVSYSYFDNLKYLLQRVAAVGVLFFLGAHIYLAMIKPRFLEDHPERFSDFSREMFSSAEGPTLIVYLLGTLGVAYHLGNGLFSWCWTWGLVSGRRSLRTAGALSVALFVVLLALAWAAIYGVYSAGSTG